MWSCFKLLNNGRNPTEKDSMSTLEMENPGEEQFRFLKGKTKKESFMIANGGRILEELICSFDGRTVPFRTFSKQELQIATNNYAQDGIFDSSFDQLYRGTLEDREISVRRPHGPATEIGIQEYINEFAVSSQMSHHKHVLKLLGCCLETQVPTLVYEFAENGNLSEHIYKNSETPSKWESSLTWDNRLRIATEVADAITYLHTGTSKRIIHRDIKPGNIFLGKNFVAKLFEFGLSVSIPSGETYVESTVAGTRGFIAPDDMAYGRYTEKSDVYSFGCVLLEILTGTRVTHIHRNEWCFENNNLERYLKANFLDESNTEQSTACAELTLKCVKVNPEERHTMMEVAYELRRIKVQCK